MIGAGLSIPDSVPTDDQVRRFMFEVVCFALFIVMGQKIPKRLNAAEGREFNTKVLERRLDRLADED